MTFAKYWSLDPSVTFLNHGSFGACPTAVLEAQSELRQAMESEPVRFLLRELPDLFDEARRVTAEFVGADADNFVFVDNATTGVNAVLRSLDLATGDELLITDHAYNACRNALEFVAEKSGARVVRVPLPFPLSSPDEVVEAILAAVTSQTRLALIDHITSPTGLVLPVKEIVDRLREQGVETFVDGAHGPGMVPLDIGSLGAAYYTANCHKWLCAPKGAAFLVVREDLRESVRPLVISHGASASDPHRSRFHQEFDWCGTRDFSPSLSIPRAIEVVGGMVEGGWTEIMKRNRSLVIEGRNIVASSLGVAPPCPEEMLGTLASLPLPDGVSTPLPSALATDPLQDRLFREYGSEVPVVSWPGPPRRLIRISAHLYNEESDYQKLAAALPEALGM